ncbi:MAG: HAMP domain-containing histidine kinase [Bacteroides sp.]|nr:HAMP domain-containing histidine kinase [Bacteroides sp.]MCM1380203.1 HAMP domain-containing histidine kinase [Bacteroides sp.]MCM1446139.1 HAMP domain-containing histidine kinase [Prevotella sp.]
MKKSTIWFLTITMVLTFIGLIYVQFMYMSSMVRMRNDQFDENVSRSLYAVTVILEQQEARHFLEENLAEVEDFTDLTTSGSSEGVEMKFTTQTGIKGNLTLEGSQRQISDIKLHTQPVQLGSGKPVASKLHGQYLYQRGLLDEVILKIMSQSSSRPIQQRADSTMVRSLLQGEFANNGIDIPFDFAVTNRYHNIIYRTEGFPLASAKALRDNADVYSIALFPGDPANRVNYLSVYFPTKQNYIFSSVRFMVPSMIFTFIMLLIFLYAIIMAFMQKKNNEMRTDFINNMTHELKTPISSISLAGQMLADPAVRKSETMMKHVTDVINEDTKRLRFLVETVLQMSLYYHEQQALNLTDLNANKAIESITHNFKLKVEKYGGKLTTRLNATQSRVEVDEMHFTNVIFNLLDNAVKYRKKDTPINLEITTENTHPGKLLIKIKDNGIGIKKENLSRIFEKFYRVSTGNRHDVKGFGLGLAYVKKMVGEFHGDITVDSELGQGTTFAITLPLLTGSNNE